MSKIFQIRTVGIYREFVDVTSGKVFYRCKIDRGNFKTIWPLRQINLFRRRRELRHQSNGPFHRYVCADCGEYGSVESGPSGGMLTMSYCHACKTAGYNGVADTMPFNTKYFDCDSYFYTDQKVHVSEWKSQQIPQWF